MRFVERQRERVIYNENVSFCQVINAYMNLIKIRSESDPKKYPKVHCFNTFLYPQLLNRGYSAVHRWTKRVCTSLVFFFFVFLRSFTHEYCFIQIDLFEHTIVIVPIHLGNHWCLAEIRIKENLIKYYDSFGSPNNRCLEVSVKICGEKLRARVQVVNFIVSLCRPCCNI